LRRECEAIAPLRREQAADAYNALVRLTTLAPRIASDWFEAEREL
jgi:hypothetical protein